jgi:hypothetical protein
MVTETARDSQSQLERDVAHHIQQLEQIDKVLELPVGALLHLARPTDWKPGTPLGPPPTFPVWIRPGGPAMGDRDDDRLAQGLCAYTIQRLSNIRRRFKWLEKDDLLSAPGVRSWLAEGFIPAHHDPVGDPEGKAYFETIMGVFRSDTYGTLNPFTAAQIFRTLIEAGEDYAHEGVGFLAFFAMTWPLYRSRPDPLLLGARIEPSTPTAYVTSKCLLPVETVKSVCRRRAADLEKLREYVVELHDLSTNYRPDSFTALSSSWRFTVLLDSLRGLLLRLSEITISGAAFGSAADEVGLISQEFDGTTLDETYKAVEGVISRVIAAVGAKTREVLEEAKVVIAGIEREIVGGLSTEEGLGGLMAKRGMRFSSEHIADGDYRKDLKDAAQKALEVCHDAVSALSRATEAASAPADSPFAAIVNALGVLVEANRSIETSMRGVIRQPGEWCRSVADREVAYASAMNMSDFDPAELSSALLVAVRLSVYSGRQVKEAVGKAVQGAQPDGSWRLGHPYYSPDDEHGLRPPSADIAWTLTRCIEEHPDVDDADDALMKFVGWLERTRRFVGSKGRRDYGWRGDRMRYDDKLHTVTTAYAVNALLEIRELVEYRLWKLCEKRFTIMPINRGLDKISPVDLGVAHDRRLHSIFSHVSRITSAPDPREAEPVVSGGARRKRVRVPPPLYSLVLHGPPGSSKTVLIEGLAREMWGTAGWGRDTPPLIRITPADFTRMGESRIDSEAKLIFDLLSHLRRVTILFDEIDDLLAQRVRSDGEQVSFIGLVVPAMLNRLQDLRDACRRQEICFVLGTNYIDGIEPALIRRGRIDRALPVVYPDADSRQAVVAGEFSKWLREARMTSHADALGEWITSWCDLLVRESAGWSYNDVMQVCGEAVLAVQDAVDDAVEILAAAGAGSFPGFAAPPSATQAERDARERMARVKDEIGALLESAQAGITPPAYARRLCMHGSRAELRAEYIQYRICAQKWAATGETLVEREVAIWKELEHAGVTQREHVWHTDAFRAELASALAAVKRNTSFP